MQSSPWLLILSVLILQVDHALVQPLPDWLVTTVTTNTQLINVAPGKFRLTNGLISRDFITTPDFATVDFFSHEKQQSILRAISPESVVVLDEITYNVGGLVTPVNRGYLNRTALAENSTFDPNAFHYVSHKTMQPVAPFAYRPKRFAPKDIIWPPAGLRLDIDFKAPFWAPSYHQMVTVTVHWEMYDGIPLMAKWISLTGLPPAKKTVQAMVLSVELLAVNYQWAPSSTYGTWLHVENDMPHTNTNWYTDPSQQTTPGTFQMVVNCTYPQSGLVTLLDGFHSFRVHDLVVASSDPERLGLAVKRKRRLLAPQTQENPIFFHMTTVNSTMVRNVIDQLADVGFEMMIYSFWCGFDIESHDQKYIEMTKADIAYANSKGIEVGGYDLIVWSRTVPSYWMDVGGNGACIASGWYDYLLDRVLKFMDVTGLSMIETDGPYPGYPCSSTNHSHHRNVNDSIYWQLKYQAEFYRILREREVYINQPDYYFYYGGNKAPMGYSEGQYGLPRWMDLSVSRQGMYDDLFTYSPSVGWMFLPLVSYGGGEDSIFEPMAEHLVEYEWGLAQYLGAGVAACYRGFRLYDTDKTRDVVKRWVDFYKKYRDILTSDIVHVRRADMQGIDAYLHVNPKLKVKGLVMVFNPTNEKQINTLAVPLYYTGLTDDVIVSEQGQTGVRYQLDRQYNIYLPVNLAPLNITWFTFQ